MAENYFTVIGPSKKTPGNVAVQGWDGKKYSIPPDTTQEAFADRIRNKKGPGFFGSVGATINYGIPATYRSALASIYDAMGDDKSQAEQETLAKENNDLFNKVAGQYMIPTIQDVDGVSEFGTYIAQQAGTMAPQAAATAVGAVAGAYAAPVAGAFLGSTAISAPFFYAQNVDRQRQEKEELRSKGIISEIDYDQGKALLATGVQAGLEGLVGGVMMNGGKILNNFLPSIGVKAGTQTSQSILKTLGAVASTNAVTEVGQQAAERWQADLPLLDDEAKQEYLNAALTAAVIGIPLGAVGHYTQRNAQVEDATQAPTSPETSSEEEVKLPENSLLSQLEKEIGEKTQQTKPQTVKAMSPQEIISTVFNVADDNNSYGIGNLEEAKTYIASQPKGTEYLKGLEASNASEGFIIESARNNARLKEQQAKYQTGIEGFKYGNRGVIVDSANIAQQHSDDLRIRNIKAILDSKYGYDPNFTKGLRDSSLEKLLEINVAKDEQKTKALPKPEEKLLLEDKTAIAEKDFYQKKEALDEEYFYRKARDQGLPIKENEDKASKIIYGADGEINYVDPFGADRIEDIPLEAVKQLLDPEIGNEIASNSFVRKVTQEQLDKELGRLGAKLDKVLDDNEKLSQAALNRDSAAKAAIKQGLVDIPEQPTVAPEAKVKPSKKPKGPRVYKPNEDDVKPQDLPEPSDFILEKSLADDTVKARKENLINEARAHQIRNKIAKDIDLPDIVDKYINGDLYTSARVQYGQGSDQTDLYAFNEFLKRNFEPKNYKALAEKQKVLLSAKLKILPRDLEFWGDSFILHQGLKEFTEGKDRAFGSDIAKKFLSDQKAIKSFFEQTKIVQPSKTVVDANTAVKADKILRQQEVPSSVKEKEIKALAKQMDNLAKFNKRKMPSRDTYLQFYTGLLSSVPGLARTDGHWSTVFNVFQAKADIKDEKLNSFQRQYGKYVKSPNFKRFADILAHLKESGQEVKTNENNEILYQDKDGKTKKLDQPSSVEFIQHLKMFKAMAVDYINEARAYLDNLQDIGINRNSTLPEIATKIQSLEETIASNIPSPEAKEKLGLYLVPLKQAVSALNGLEKMVSDKIPYIPFTRFGEYGVRVLDKETKKIVHFETYEQPSLTGVTKKPSDAELKAFVKKTGVETKFKDSSKYEISPVFQLTKNNVGKYIPDAFVTAELVASLRGSNNQVLAQLADDLDTDASVADSLDVVFKGVDKERLDILKHVMARGGSKHFLKSENIPGYSTDWPRVLENHVQNMATTIANLKQGAEFAKAFAAVQKDEMPSWKRQRLNDYMQFMMDPKADYAGLRAFSFVYTMGLNASTALLQLGTVPTHIVPALSELGFNPISDMGRVTKELARGTPVILSPEFKPLPGTYSKEEIKDWQDYKEFFVTNQITDALGLSNYDTKSIKGQFRSGVEKIVNLSGFMVDRMERLSRMSMFFAARSKVLSDPNSIKIFENMNKDNLKWQGFRESRPEIPIEKAIPLFLVRDVHATFGKVSRGMAQRGIVGAGVFPFTTYVAQTLERMYDLGVHRGMRGKAELTQTMAAYLMLAGLAGVPGYELAEELGSNVLSYMTGIKTSVKKDLVRKFAEDNGFNPDIVEKGLVSTVTGMDVSQRLGLQLTVGRLIKDLFNVTSVDMSGYNPALGMWKSVLQSAEASQRGKDALEIVNPVFPVALRNLIKSIYYDSGEMLETSKGNPLPIDGTLTSNEIAGQALGFTPLKVNKAREDLFFGKSYQKGKFTIIKQRYADQIAKLRFKANSEPGPEATRLNAKAHALYNEMLATLKADPDFKQTPEFLNGFNRSIKNRLDEMKDPKVNVK